MEGNAKDAKDSDRDGPLVMTARRTRPSAVEAGLSGERLRRDEVAPFPVVVLVGEVRKAPLLAKYARNGAPVVGVIAPRRVDSRGRLSHMISRWVPKLREREDCAFGAYYCGSAIWLGAGGV